MLEVQQRGAERLIALEQQVGDAARAGEAGADGLRRRLAVQVVRVADALLELRQERARLRAPSPSTSGSSSRRASLPQWLCSWRAVAWSSRKARCSAAKRPLAVTSDIRAQATPPDA